MRQILSTAVTAVIVSLLTLTVASAMAQAEPAPAERAFAPAARVNADRVDGKHAVGFTNKRGPRRGRLVATNNRGELPSNIVRPLWGLMKGMPAGFADGVDNAGLTGLRVVRVKSNDFPATGGGASSLRTLPCPAGSVAIGGGAEMDSADINIVSSYPSAGLAGWEIRYRKDSPGSAIWRMYAVCLSVDPAEAITAAGARK